MQNRTQKRQNRSSTGAIIKKELRMRSAGRIAKATKAADAAAEEEESEDRANRKLHLWTSSSFRRAAMYFRFKFQMRFFQALKCVFRSSYLGTFESNGSGLAVSQNWHAGKPSALALHQPAHHPARPARAKHRALRRQSDLGPSSTWRLGTFTGFQQ